MNLIDFFEGVQEIQIPVFILTANGLSTSKPQIMPDILRAALNLEIPPERLIRAGFGGGITKPEAIRDIIIPLADSHWSAIANRVEAEEGAKAAAAAAEQRRIEIRRRRPAYLGTRT